MWVFPRSPIFSFKNVSLISTHGLSQSGFHSWLSLKCWKYFNSWAWSTIKSSNYVPYQLVGWILTIAAPNLWGFCWNFVVWWILFFRVFDFWIMWDDRFSPLLRLYKSALAFTQHLWEKRGNRLGALRISNAVQSGSEADGLHGSRAWQSLGEASCPSSHNHGSVENHPK